MRELPCGYSCGPDYLIFIGIALVIIGVVVAIRLKIIKI